MLSQNYIKPTTHYQFLSPATDIECPHTCDFLLTNGLPYSKLQPKVCLLWLSFLSKIARISSHDLTELRSKQSIFDLALRFKQAAVQDLFQRKPEEIQEKHDWYLQYRTMAHIQYLSSLSMLQENTTAIHSTSQQSHFWYTVVPPYNNLTNL